MRWGAEEVHVIVERPLSLFVDGRRGSWTFPVSTLEVPNEGYASVQRNPAGFTAFRLKGKLTPGNHLVKT